MSTGGPQTLGVSRVTVVTLAAAVVALLLVVVAAASGPVDVVTAPVSSATATLPSVTPTSAPATRTPDLATRTLPGQAEIPELPELVVFLVKVLVYALGLFILVLLGQAAWRGAPRWRSRTLPPTVVVALPDVPEELTASADARMALLMQGSPRNAVVACWLDLEETAASAGLPRAAHETSAEYTTRVLTIWRVGPQSLSGLAALYREARFSRHPLTEEHRAKAIDQLTTLHEDLRRIVAERAAERALRRAAEDAARAEHASTADDNAAEDDGATGWQRSSWGGER